MTKLKNMASIIRSKNSGPFLIVFDIIFDDPDRYRLVKESGVIDVELFASVYRSSAASVVLSWYDPGLAVKAAMPRAITSGDLGDSDILGCQQSSPLQDVEIPEGFPL